MVTLTEFLNARLDEDEAAAQANIGAGPGWSHGLGDTEGTGPSWPDYQTFDGADLDAATGYLDRFRPLRMLREVEAKRAIVTAHPVRLIFNGTCEACSAPDGSSYLSGLEEFIDWPCPTLRALAAVYSDHPDYRPEWTP